MTDANFSVLILHHNRKEGAGQFNPAQAMRGSSDILASADCHIAVSRIGQSEFVKLTQTKNRDLWEPAPFELRFQENAREFEYVGTGKSPAEWHQEQLDEVKSFVENSPGLSKRQIVMQVKAMGHIKAGNKKIGELLDELFANQAINMQLGDRRSYQYYPLTDGSASKTQ